MDAEPVFVDTNVLVHANNEESPFQQEARQRLLDLAADGRPLWISRQVLREYAAVLSRLMNEKNAFNGPVIVADLQRFDREFLVADDNAAVSAQLQALLPVRRGPLARAPTAIIDFRNLTPWAATQRKPFAQGTVPCNASAR